ncbi:MAG: hypothetical protein E6Q77_06110 [Rhizobium sp.]|nr:MAG: hypothetical protein E6Q77_06110 [Rhizobium sp.]
MPRSSRRRAAVNDLLEPSPLIRPSGTFSPKGEGGSSHSLHRSILVRHRYSGKPLLLPSGRRWPEGPDEGAPRVPRFKK